VTRASRPCRAIRRFKLTHYSNPLNNPIQIGVDVGGTFTDLVAFDGRRLAVVKVPSTPPDFDRAVVEAVRRAVNELGPAAAAAPGAAEVRIVHGSTVATNALLQRAGEPVAFVTTEGFRDMLLIGRQNRPKLYALRVERPRPLTPEENWFTVRERVAATGEVIEPLDPAEVDRLVATVKERGLTHVAVCLLFSFVNPAHERLIGERCARAGLTVSLSCDVLPEFREYERASTTVINASLRPTVDAYLRSLAAGLAAGSSQAVAATPSSPPPVSSGEGDAGVAATKNGALPTLRIMHSAGGTLAVEEAGTRAARLVLSGPAGGVMGAALVAGLAGEPDVITYDMGGTSTDVAAILKGRPQWTTSSVVDGLPLGLPTLDIETVGAGGGSVACLDAGGALRVGPRSAGAAPGPACYGRGGAEPTVTDANLVLGRILPARFLGGAMRIHADLASRAVAGLAAAMGKTPVQAALGIVRVAEANMASAVRAVTARRGHDPRGFALLSFGGAGGLHACALAEALDVARVVVPPYCGVLSALGMVAAAPVADASQTVVHLGDRLDDHRLAAEYTRLSGMTMDHVAYEQTESVEAWADVRFKGQSHELTVRTARPSLDAIADAFRASYAALYGSLPEGKPVEVVTLRIRRFGKTPRVELPRLDATGRRGDSAIDLVDATGTLRTGRAVGRADLLGRAIAGPMLIVDAEATTYVPPGWSATAREDGTVLLSRTSS
jgi:N-methylhydantoinase A